MHVHRPGATIKLRSASPRTAVCASVNWRLGRGRLGWSGGGGAEPVGTTQAARSDHPCRGPGRSRSPIQPIRGPAESNPPLTGRPEDQQRRRKVRECSGAEPTDWAGAADRLRPKAGWIWEQPAVGAVGLSLTVGFMDSWKPWFDGAAPCVEPCAPYSVRLILCATLPLGPGVKTHGSRGLDLSICMLQKPNHDHGCSRSQPETRAAGTEGHPWRLPAFACVRLTRRRRRGCDVSRPDKSFRRGALLARTHSGPAEIPNPVYLSFCDMADTKRRPEMRLDSAALGKGRIRMYGAPGPRGAGCRL